ncbi:unnamed protein product [Leptidea sinapis]|uniref:Uncharacterized protein n=1 Tax=Leptidea sinapis TaxID=189913 RepID=A0A5E4QRP4_9NEOP|nr:unnamed protein product [Leptidea sinapis]
MKMGATLPLTADTAAMAQAGNSSLSIHDHHLSQCIQLKQNYLNNSTTNVYQSLTNFQSPMAVSTVSIDDPLCRRMGDNDIMYADQLEADISEAPKTRNFNCECGLCPKPESKDVNTLSDLQRSVAQCSCDACHSNGDILNYYRQCPNQSQDSGIVYCDTCKKQKISVSNFRALQIANRLQISDAEKLNGTDEELCRRIDRSLDMGEYEHRKRHNRHHSDSTGIDLSQFCQCEIDKRKTSSVDEIFKMADDGSSKQEDEEEVKASQRQRSLSDSQRDKAKLDAEGAEEGIYTLNLNELHETAMDQLCPRRTIWMHVIKDVLMSLSGCTVCAVARNPYNGYKYLCGATPAGLFLMQWYDPLRKFMLLKLYVMSSGESWFHSDELEMRSGGSSTVLPRPERLHTLRAVHQLSKDAVKII